MTTAKLDNAAGYNLGGTLMPHQAEGLAWLLEHPRALLADSVGLGKTVQVAALLLHLHCRGLLDRGRTNGPRVLIVAPKSLIAQWQAELAAWVPGLTTFAHPHAVTATQRKRLPAAACDIELVNVESLRANLGGYEAKRYPLVVVDELSADLRSGGKNHTAVHSVCRSAKRVVGLTATPMETSLMDTWTLLYALGVPKLPTKSEWSRYVEWLPASHPNGYGGFVTDYKPGRVIPHHVPAVRAFLETCLLRRTPEEVGLDLPIVVERRHDVQMTPEQAQAYAAAERLTGLARHQARDKASAHADGASAKASLAVNLVHQSPPTDQAVIFAQNLAHLDIIGGALDERGISFVRLTGETQSTTSRQAALDAFRSGEARVLIGNEVLERGLNLQLCPWLISCGEEYNPARNEQRVGRIRRIGSPFPVVYHDVISTGSATDRGRETSAALRQADFNLVFGSGAEPTDFRPVTRGDFLQHPSGKVIMPLQNDPSYRGPTQSKTSVDQEAKHLQPAAWVVEAAAGAGGATPA